MNLKVGFKYFLVFCVNGKLLTYRCTITNIDDNFISFIDKFNTEFSYNKSILYSSEEIKEENGTTQNISKS